MQKLIASCVNKLINSEVLLYPTDTIWGIGCDATNKIAVDKIYKLKKREESKSLIILVDSFEMLQNYIVKTPNKIEAYLLESTEPTTVIYHNPKNIAKNLIAKDNTIAIRIVNKGFAHKLIKQFGKPIVSTSANISGKKTPLNFEGISNEIKNKVDFVVKVKEEKLTSKSSKIIRFANNKIDILRD